MFGEVLLKNPVQGIVLKFLSTQLLQFSHGNYLHTEVFRCLFNIEAVGGSDDRVHVLCGPTPSQGP